MISEKSNLYQNGLGMTAGIYIRICEKSRDVTKE